MWILTCCKGLEKADISEGEWGKASQRQVLSWFSKNQVEGLGKGDGEKNGLQEEASDAWNKHRGMEEGKGGGDLIWVKDFCHITRGYKGRWDGAHQWGLGNGLEPPNALVSKHRGVIKISMWLKKAKSGSSIITDFIKDVGLWSLAVIQEWRNPVPKQWKDLFIYLLYTEHHPCNNPVKVTLNHFSNRGLGDFERCVGRGIHSWVCPCVK